MLVHGFPDTPATWRHLGPVLADTGFRVVAPWTRGYAPTAIPADGDYTVHARAADLNRLHDVLGGGDDAVLVGHDWGANSAYAAAAAAPQRWRRVVALSVPPEPVMHGMVRRLPDLGRAWYMLAAQLPLSGWLARADLRPLMNLWRSWSPDYQMTDEDRTALQASLRHPDNVRAALSYYRAHIGDGFVARYPRADGPVPTQPTLYLHGAADRCVRPAHVDGATPVLQAANPRSQAQLVSDAGHWPHLEQPEVVRDLVLRFLAGA